MKALTEDYNISYGLFVDRRTRQGWSTAEALGLKERKSYSHQRSDPISFQGKSYKTISECARAYSKKPNLVRNRVKNGWTLGQALDAELAPRRKASRRHEILFEGTIYASRPTLAIFYGINPELFAGRCYKGWTIRQALNLDRSPRRRSWRDDSKIINGRAYPQGSRGSFKLYVIVCQPTGKEYVGVTTGPLSKRFGEHVSNAKYHAGGSSKLYRAIRKYGPEQFSICLLRKNAKDYKTLLQQELVEVTKRNTFKRGLNATPGGENVNQNRPIRIKGTTFVSFSAACEVFKIPEYLARSRLDTLGWTKEQAFGLAPRPTDWGPKRIKLKNRQYDSLKEACEKLGKDYSLVAGRLYKGWSNEQAFGFEPLPEDHPPGQPKEIIVQGKKFFSYSEVGRAYGLREGTVSSRLRAGWSIEQALSLVSPPKPEVRGKAIVVEGAKYSTIKSAATHYGLALSLVSARLQNGWSKEEAFSIVPRKEKISKGTVVTVNGTEFPSIQSACKTFKVPYVTYKGRKKKGYTLRQALGLDEVKRITPNAKPITVKQVNYPSLKEACQAHKLPFSRVQARLSAGWSINEAFDLVSRPKITPSGQRVTIKGRTFLSLNAACKHYGVTYQVFYLRRKRGYSIEKSLVNFTKPVPHNSKSITLKGQKYNSITEACRKLGIAHAKVNSRLARGASMKQAFKEIYTL